MAPDDAVNTPTSGARTFLFTDIEGSTRKAIELGEDWFEVLQTHHEVLRPVFAAHGGTEVSTAGDSFFVVFDDAADAISATVAMQRAIAAHDWSPGPPMKVRMGLHTGLARFRDNDYAGLTVHAASRVESAAAGAQVLITQATLDAAGADLADGIDMLDLGFHRLKDLPSELRLYQVVAEGLEREFPTVRGIDVVRNNVPVPPSSFVGRTTVLTRLHQMLDEDRLVTIVGPGGTGKTRVSLRLASERLHRHADGVWFVELDPARDETGVVTAIATVLGVREERDSPLLDTLTEYVRDTNVLLVIDNCEHVIDDVARVLDQILRSGPGVRVLATSREAIEISGERTWPLAPLAIDDDDPASSEAVLLLVERVERVQPDFELTPELVPAAVTIARRLDGLPLALELAAASAASLSLDEISQQLDSRFELLTRGSRTALDRQKTLWGAIDWSYGLLDDEQQRLFRRLGVFPSDFDFGLARNVCGDRLLDVDEALDVLRRKSLVTESPAARQRLLESVRAYAREQLTEAGEFEEFAERHARFFVDSLKKKKIQDTEWIDTINEDLAAAMRWGGEHDPEVQLRALIELQPFWNRKGRWTEGRTTSDEVLAATTGIMIKPRWNALANTGQLAMNQGEFAKAREYFEQAIKIAEVVGGPAEAQMVLGDLGDIAVREGDLETADELYRRALDAARVLKNERAVAMCLAHLVQIATFRGDLVRAWNDGNEALEVVRSLHWDELDLRLTALVGDIARQRGELGAARRILNDAHALARKMDNREVVMNVAYACAQVELDDDEPANAAPLVREALTLGEEFGAEADLAESLEAAARLTEALGSPDIACRLLAATETLRERLSLIRQPAAAREFIELVDTLKPQCSDRFDECWSEGAAWSLTEAVAAAVEFLDSGV